MYRGGGNTQKIIIGKIYSNGCGHCQAMQEAWEQMKSQLKNKYGDSIDIWDIEANEEAAKKAEFKMKYKELNVDLVSSGYPTIFKIVNGHQVDYNGNRDLKSLLTWATQKKTI
jgi:thiol-disulfide isomerase/thioredoxin